MIISWEERRIKDEILLMINEERQLENAINEDRKSNMVSQLEF